MAGADDKAPDWREEAKNWLHRRLGRKGFLALSLALAVLGGGFYVWDSLLDRPGLAQLTELATRKPVPRADPKRFSVMVARIGADTGDVLGNQIFEVLREFEGVQTLPLDRSLGGAGRMDEQEQREGEHAARDYLRVSGASVLVWGRIIDADKHIARLFLTSASTEKGQPGRQVAPEIGTTVRLPDVFWGDLAKVLRLVVASRAAEFDESRYVADRLPAFIAAAERLLTASRGRPEWDADARGATLMALADAQLTLGVQSGNNAPLEQAIESYRAALQERTRQRVPLDWAVTQNNLGLAFWRLGERESGTARLEEAVAAYRAALEEQTRDRVPLDWALTQNNLGLALWRLGERESGTARLEEAVAAYRAALEEQTRDRVPLDWALTQNNLGLALWRLGERESGTARLEEAVAAYRAALEERTRDRVPLYWATTQNNLGLALWRLGERESGTARLEEAVAAYRAALEEQTRERVPLNWATTQNNLGLALWRLGERESGTARLEEAVAAYRAALEERTRERVPLQWAWTQENLGITLKVLGQRQGSAGTLRDAVYAYEQALSVYSPQDNPYYFDKATRGLAEAKALLAERLQATAAEGQR